jgi:hypothetical protein
MTVPEPETRDRSRRVGRRAITPRAVRTLAFIAVGWSAFGAIVVGLFATVLAPATGGVMHLSVGTRFFQVIHFTLDTAGLVVASLWIAAVLVVLAVVAVLVSRSTVMLARTFATIVCIATPLLVGFVLPNAVMTIVDPDRENGVLAVAAVALNLLVIFLAWLSLAFGPALVDEWRAGTLFRRRTSRRGVWRT